MRNIEFRGKPTENNTSYIGEEFVYGSLVIDNGKYYILLNVNDNINRDDYEVYMIEVIPETVGQYTGLHDKNGKEIYEGDIVKAVVIKQNRNIEDEVEEKIMPVVFEKGEFLLKDNTTAFGATFHHLRSCKRIEVISNMYDNPELLEKEGIKDE